MTSYRSALPDPPRGLLRVSGADRHGFLQGLVSNDIALAGAGRAVWAALLTAQGKYLHDFFIVEAGDAFLIDAEGPRLDDLRRRLSLYKLRAKVAIETVADRTVRLAWGGDGGLPALGGDALVFADPRHGDLGSRIITPADTPLPAGFVPADYAEWDRLRLALGVPDGSRDMVPEKAILLENGFDELHGVAWDKGCYVGQELTARTKYRGLVKKRLVPVRLDGAVPAAGTIIMQDGQEAGEMRSARAGIGVALLRLDALGRPAPLTADGTILHPEPPAWLAL